MNGPRSLRLNPSACREIGDVTPVLPGVKGRVTEVLVQANTPLKEGDVLFRIDPRPYEYVIDQKRAGIAEAEQTVKQLKASLDEATAGVEKANVQLRLAEDNHNRQVQLFEKQVIAQATLDVAQRNFDAARQAFAAAQAVGNRAQLAYESEIGGVNPTVARLTAELSDAEYDFNQTTTRAPTDGFVTQMALRPGMYVVPAPPPAGHGFCPYFWTRPSCRSCVPAECPSAGQVGR
jgi:multidrug resistance efflux pump